MQTISLLVLIVAIAIGFWKNINVGIVSLALGFILTAAMGISVKVLVAGFPTKLFLTLLGTMYFFALLQDNQTLELLSRKIISLFKTRPFLMPVVIYVVSYVMSAAGPGAISVQSVMVIFAVSLAVQMKANPILMAVMAILGGCWWDGIPHCPDGNHRKRPHGFPPCAGHCGSCLLRRYGSKRLYCRYLLCGLGRLSDDP